jgi:anti-anti-sigma factor
MTEGRESGMRQTDLRVWTEEWEGTPVIRAEGEIDLSSVDEFRSAASTVVRLKPPAVIFDLREVSYIDSSGLGVLVATRRHLGSDGSGVTVVTGQDAVLQTLQITGLDRIFRVTPEPPAVPTRQCP